MDTPVKNKFPKKLIIVSSFVVLFLYIGFGIAGRFAFGKIDNPGIFGDMFGSINALFSGFALLGIILTIYLQTRELELQRIELTETREVIKDQKQEMSQQNSTLSLQRFENSFFNLLSSHTSIVSEIEMRDKHVISKILSSGRNCFEIFYRHLKSTYQEVKSTPIERINDAYESHYINHQKFVGHYFRNIYNIVKYIDSSNINNKQFYVNLLRAQLSSMELINLFYNCLSEYGKEQFKPLVEKYALLENMDFSLLFEDTHKSLYADSAFKEQEPKLKSFMVS